MSAQVDAVKGEVTAGGVSWRFDLDCRQGTVAVDFGGARVRLRPHSWREKRILARFAHLGEVVLRDQFVRLCLDETTPLPAEGPQRDALWALALWLNAPGGESTLPLDERVLATVTLQVCHAIQSPPGALDGLDAADVELLWRAARGEPARSAGDQPEGTRIIIVPDRPAAAPEELVGAGTVDPAAPMAPRPERTAPVDSTARPAATAATTSPPPAEPVPGASDSRGGHDKRAPAADESAPQRNGRFRVIVDSPLRPAPRPAAAPPASAPAAAGHGHRAEPTLGARPPAGPPESPPLIWPGPLGMASRALATLPATRAADPHANAVPRVLVAPQSRAQAAGSSAVPPEPTAHVLGLADDLFDELAIRLEQAAGELGIDVEG